MKTWAMEWLAYWRCSHDWRILIAGLDYGVYECRKCASGQLRAEGLFGEHVTRLRKSQLDEAKRKVWMRTGGGK